jgi:hypothetical protein
MICIEICVSDKDGRAVNGSGLLMLAFNFIIPLQLFVTWLFC